MMVFPLTFDLPPQITAVTLQPTADGAPANCYMNGHLILDPSFFQLPQDYQYFIVCHEAGHIATQSAFEHDADEYGFWLYIKSGRSLKALVAALADVLTFTRPEHLQRTEAMLKRCAQFDLINNNNTMIKSINYGNPTASLFGFTPLKNLQTAFDKYQDRRDIKVQSKAEAKVNKSEAKILRAEKGGTVSDTIGNYSSGLMDLAGNLFGGNKTAQSQPMPVDEAKKKNTVIILVVVGVVVVSIAAYFLLRKK